MHQLSTLLTLLMSASTINGTVADHTETLQAHTAIFCKFKGQFDDHGVKKAMDRCFARIDQALADHQLQREAGTYRMMAVGTFSEETASLSGEVAVAIEPGHDLGPLSEDLRVGKTPAGQAVRFETAAPYGEPNEFYEDISKWVTGHKVRRSSEAWEVYVRQGDAVAPKDRMTRIYYLIGQ